MEKTVTLRFYDVSRTRSDRPALGDLLQLIAALPLMDRQKLVTDDEILVRLENFSVDGLYLSGQFIRGQSANRPGQMTPNGTQNLPFNEPIGHGIAFRYRLGDGLLAIEYNPLILSPSRAIAYVCEFDAMAEYDVVPRLRPDAWDEFNNRPLRKMVVSIAGHPHVANQNDPHAATWNNLANMRDAYGAHTLKIEVGMGHHQGSLCEGAKAFMREAFNRHKAGDTEIRTIRGVVETGEGVPNEEIDLLGELLDFKEELTFPDNNFDQFYNLRRDLLTARINLL
jgi:hypothetical protein